jgi:Zn-finger nucleic acid-binding protein
VSQFTYRLHREPFRKPSKNEEEYFYRQKFEKRRAKARQKAEERASEERERLMELHRDRCPRCGERLEHIRIKEAWADQCPVCEGVWLDREVFALLTHEKQQPLAAMFRYMLVDQSLGDIQLDREE